MEYCIGIKKNKADVKEKKAKKKKKKERVQVTRSHMVHPVILKIKELCKDKKCD